MQEKVFKGIVATGYMEYQPWVDPLVQEGTHIEDFEDAEQDYVDTDGAEGDDAEPFYTPPPFQPSCSGIKMNVRKRRRGSGKPQNTQPSIGDVNSSMLEYLHIMKGESANSVQQDTDDKAMTYTEAIQLFRAQTWVEIPSKYFTAGVSMLADKTYRIAFANLVDLGEEVIKGWIDFEQSR